MKVHQFRYFSAVARCGGFAQAAAELGIARTSLERGVAQLEEVTGAVLLNRKRAVGVELTAEGRLLLPKVLALIDEMEALRSLFRPTDALNGHLRIGCHEALATYFLPAILNRLAIHYPRLKVSLRECDIHETHELLKAREVHAVLTFSLDQVQTSNTTTVPLRAVDPYVVVRSDHPRAAKPMVRQTDLANYPFILFDSRYASERIMRYFDASQPLPEIAMRSRSSNVIRSLVSTSNAFSILHIKAPSDLSPVDKAIKCIPLHNITGGAAIAITYLISRDVERDAAVRGFVDATRAEILSSSSSQFFVDGPDRSGENRL